ncbi:MULTISPECIES: DUF445 domain-containing protein [Psychrilyobacter]|uniref:DUF445 family protein n=1 Tax=Psychrilyobacter piezotolerans TaxID=2293438 RepID=A0ABX9KL92_9FUSO|nr:MULTISPECIES: DUF445 family protein [Psychrilyobacter]MCS5422593.1 DUF445 family protein [Psychrilyobacter sp. S5]NDI76561.1 DUF445 family protein [Psychrilyobacter piezotolerans]RDE66152.1 DUF445 family protein [Psychrilyobacter sp. S5]REI43330.1 DUF445 family protein [Psychrilyobacter piezotolerans]
MLLKASLMIVIGALIGWITNYFAIKMLFRPLKEINILGFRVQGLIPKRKMEMAESIADTIQEELISMKDITANIGDIELGEEIDLIVDRIVEDKLEKQVLAKIPMASLFITDSMILKIKGHIKDAIDENKDEFFTVLIQKMEDSVDMKNIIIEKIENFELDELEKMVYRIANNELKHIEVIGAILGAVIGGIQFAISLYI